MSNPIGHHVVLDLYDCECDLEVLTSAVEGKKILEKLSSFVSPLDIKVHQFEPYSWSGILLIEESHISFHSWTQHRFVSCDVFTCMGRICEEAVEEILKIFKPRRVARGDITRGTGPFNIRSEVSYAD